MQADKLKGSITIFCCLLASIIANAVILTQVANLLLYPNHTPPEKTPRSKSRSLKIELNKKEEQKETASIEQKSEQKKPEPPPFIKTSPDQETPSRPPRDPDFIASRDTEESSESAPTSQLDAAETAGEEEKGEIVTFDQRKQEGDLRYDGLRSEITPSQSETAAAVPPTLTPPSDQAALPLPPVPTEDTPDQPMADQLTQPSTTPSDTEPLESQNAQPAESPLEARQTDTPELPNASSEEEHELDASLSSLTGLRHTLNPYDKGEEGDLLFGTYQPPLPTGERFSDLDATFSMQPAEPVVPDEPEIAPHPGFKTRLRPVRRSSSKTVYDPSFTPSAQPGFRTNERKRRSPGRFVFGGKSSYKAKATPLGRYHELIYRRIAYYWYQACAERRGDIVVGTLIIRLIINANGSIDSMELMQRRGASVSQQAFTFAAIRKASLPPIPSNVREELIGDKMDLVFEFHFD